jgi:hypothetical protein
MAKHQLSTIGRVAYPTFAKARKRSDTAKPRWSVTLVYDAGTNLEAMKDYVRTVVLEKYPNGPPKKFVNPFKLGDCREREDGTLPEGFAADDVFCEFWRYEEHGAVPIVGPDRNVILPQDIYAGCLGRVSFRAFCYDVDGNKGVSLGLEAFQKAGEGTAIGAAPVDPQTEFGDIEQEVADVEDLF